MITDSSGPKQLAALVTAYLSVKSLLQSMTPTSASASCSQGSHMRLSRTQRLSTVNAAASYLVVGRARVPPGTGSVYGFKLKGNNVLCHT